MPVIRSITLLGGTGMGGTGRGGTPMWSGRVPVLDCASPGTKTQGPPGGRRRRQRIMPRVLRHEAIKDG